MPPRPPDPDYYRILGVKPSASAAEIKKAYRRLAVKHHPDKQRPNKAEAATQKLAKINQAYTVLGDADQRRMHDLQRTDAAGPSAQAGAMGCRFQHFFQNFWLLRSGRLLKLVARLCCRAP